MTEQQHERSESGAERIDAALDRRGFTTWPLRVRAAVVVAGAVAVVAGAGAFLANNLSNAFGPDSVCDGAVSAAALNDALGPGKVSGEKNGAWESPSGGAFCTATVSYGVFGNSRSVFVQVDQADDLGPYPASAGDRLFAASANGGAAGAARDDRAWALLPGECGTGLRVEVKSGGEDGPGAGKLARLAAAAVNGVAADKGCGKTPFPAPHALSQAGHEHDLNSGSICGLPGFTATGAAGGNGYKESVNTAFDPVWTCRISTDRSPFAYSFTIGTEPRLRPPVIEKDTSPAFGRSRWATPLRDREVVATCQGRPTYFRMDSDILQTLFPSTEEAWKQFLTAGAKTIGCEPIL
ncbi:hypothetical protein [Kitasatospora cathayae]|uniref:Septum formation-related domain-containing protein n=1 Tax=Kitasatospora cathayae TaxID=3004092 RepID=A0ABY7QAI3_9ACTN|nr:hypothetical protein [Kitasatospora sp. HUAS 3-15]WBP89667.1 hypothetical protein O1G21_30010 [Kitasatospora sp. HUAS 3-15]